MGTPVFRFIRILVEELGQFFLAISFLDTVIRLEPCQGSFAGPPLVRDVFQRFQWVSHKAGPPVQGWIYMILIAVTLAVAAIPEGIPLCVTISLAIGCQEMVAKNVQAGRG